MPSSRSRDTTQFDRRFEYTSLEDFTPGIVTRGTLATSLGSAAPAKLGAAQLNGTYACRALPEGGLEPLPKMITTYNIPNPDVQGNLVAGYYNVSGFFGIGPVGPPAVNASGANDDIFLGLEWLKSGGTRNMNYYRLNLDTIGTPVDTLAAISSAVLPALQQYYGMCFTASRMNPVAPYLTPGTPVVVADWAPPSFSADKHVWIFPNPSSPAITGVVDLASAGTVHFGDIIGHQGRIVILEWVTNPFGGNSGDAIPTNENVSWTDPFNSNQLPNPVQAAVFMLEWPNGFGAWGSISAGELFLVKNAGGGIIVTGDLATGPALTRLPGVVPCNGTGSRAASTLQGLFYYSRYNGAYVWRGADTSEKISSPLDDQFPVITGQANLLSQNVCFHEWSDYILCSNNWLYDTITKAWWQLDNQPLPVQWYARGFGGEILYACPLQVTAAQTTGAIRVYRRTTPAPVWSWQSHPIPASLNRLLDIRELILLAQGNGTVQVTLTNDQGGTQVESFNVTNTTQPQRLRLLTEARGYNIVVQMLATGTAGGSAPVVYALHLGWRDQVFAGTT